MKHIIKTILQVTALLAVTLACSLSASAPPPEIEQLSPQPLTLQTEETGSINFGSRDTQTEEPDDQTTTTNSNSTASNSTTGSSSVQAPAVVVQPAILPACTPRTDWTATYTVVAGDTLAAIGRQVGASFQTLATGNCLADASRIEVGQILRVPGTVAPAPVPATVSLNSTGQHPVSTDGNVTFTGTSSGLSGNGRVILTLLDVNGTARQEVSNLVSPQGTWGITLQVGSVTSYPGSTPDIAPMSVQLRGINGSGAQVATANYSIFLARQGQQSPPPEPDSFINITRADVSVNKRTVTIGGDAQGLFEGNVVVELFDAQGRRLIQRPTTQSASEMGGYGPWQITISVDGMATDNNGRVLAYSTSPRDGSVIASDEAVINFNFENVPAGSIEVEWSPFDVMITPDVNNQIVIGGRVDGAPNSTVRVSLVGMNQSTLPGTERTITTDGNGGWWIDDMVMPAGYVGNFQIFATLLDNNGDVIVTDVQDVLITESVSAASRTTSMGSYTITVPTDWFDIGDAGFVGFATYPPSNVPPGAAYGPYIMEFGASTRPYSDGQTLESVAAEIEEQVSNPAVGVEFTRENTTLADGTPAVLMAHTGGTGKRIYTLVFDSGQDFVVATALGSEDVVIPLLLRMTRAE